MVELGRPRLMKKITFIVIGILIILVFIIGYYLGDAKKVLLSANKGKSPAIIAQIGPKTIALDEFERQVNLLKERYQQNAVTPEQQEKLLDLLIDQKLVYLLAKEQGYEKKDVFKKEMELAKETIAVNLFVEENVFNKLNISLEEAKDFYAQHLQEFQSVERRDISCIMVDSKPKMLLVNAALRAGETFADVAKNFSQDESAINNGAWGWIVTKDSKIEPILLQAAFSIKEKGELSNQIKFNKKYYLLRLNDIQPAVKIDFAQAQNKIMQTLQQQKQSQILDGFVKKAREKYKVTKNFSAEK